MILYKLAIFSLLLGSSLSSNVYANPEETKEIVLGVSNAQTGPAKELGLNLTIGSEVFFDKVNKKGGVKNHQIRMIKYDDGYEPTRTIQNVIKLMKKDSVLMFFDFVGTPTSKVAVPIISRAKIPYFGPFTGAEFLRNPVNKYVFNVRASYFDETEALVRYFVDQKKFTKIAMFIQDDGYGAAGRAGVQKALHKRGLHNIAVGKYQRNTKNVGKALEILKQAQPEAIIMIGAYEPCAEFIKQAKEAGMTSNFANISFVGTEALLKTLGSKGEGVVISQVVPDPYSRTRFIKQYREDMKAAGHGLKVGYGTLEGYINAYVLVKGFENVEGEFSGENIVSALERTQFDVGDINFAFSENNHQALSNVYLTVIHHRNIVELK